MGTINLAFNITGPMWAWWALCIIAGIHAVAYCVKVAADIVQRRLFQRRLTGK